MEAWGTRTYDESALFEALTLGVFEIGLSWSIAVGVSEPGGAGQVRRDGRTEMTGAVSARGWSPGRVTAVAVLAVIGVLAIIAGIVYLTEPARSLPAILGTITHPASRADAHRATRGWASLAIGVVLVVAAAFASRPGRSSPR